MVAEYAKNYLNCVYDMNYDVAVKPEYCMGFSAEEILEAFASYRQAVSSIFLDMSKDEADRDTELICLNGLFAVLYATGANGVLSNNEITVNCAGFKASLQKVKRKYINIAIATLNDYGFIFEGNIWGKNSEFTLHFPDDNKVILGLYSFSQTITMNLVSTLWNMNWRFAAMDARLYGFSRNEKKYYNALDELFRFVQSENERRAISIFHQKMNDNNFSHNLYFCVFSPIISIRYDLSQYQPRAELKVSDKTCHLAIWMKNNADNTAYIQNCSEGFRNGCIAKFDDCKNSLCERSTKKKTTCKGKLIFTVNNQIYEKCTHETSWGYSGSRAVFRLDESEIDTYMYFIKSFDD